MKCAAGNPCAPTSRLFGDIDYEGLISIDLGLRRIEFDGKIDQFPAFESYASINDLRGVTLFQEPPPPGNTVMNLPGSANRRIRCRPEDRDGDRVFDNLTTCTLSLEGEAQKINDQAKLEIAKLRAPLHHA